MAENKDDRRTERSCWASEALHHQLKRVVTRYDLETVVLTDGLGHLWAASSLDPPPAGLLTHLKSQGLLDPAGINRSSRRGRCSVTVRKLRVGPATLFLAAQGARQRSRPALKHAAGGVARILGDLHRGEAPS